MLVSSILIPDNVAISIITIIRTVIITVTALGTSF